MSTQISAELSLPDPLIFTDSAAAKVKELMDEENNPNLKLRIYVEGGGCSGFKYNFMFDDTISADDTVIEKSVQKKNPDGSEVAAEDDSGSSSGTVQLIVDPHSLQYLKDATVDFRVDAQGAQFVIRNNRNAKTTCGCGSSFNT